MKKAQGISITTIIIAAIALIVLVVLVLIFSGRMGIFNRSIEEQEQGMKCEDTATAKRMVKTATVGCGEEFNKASPAAKVKGKMLLGTFENLGPGEICCEYK